MIGEQIVQEIDKTLDQLIRNAEAISNIDLKDLSDSELEAFQKTQESLLQHLMHMDQSLGSKQHMAKLDRRSANYKIQEKLLKFEHLKSNYNKQLTDTLSRRPIVCKRKAKRFFDLRFRKKCTLILLKK